MPDFVYTKCAHCHLFVEPNSEADTDPTLAAYVHLHRGTPDDEALDATHDAAPSGWSGTLDYWRANGPYAMRARFID